MHIFTYIWLENESKTNNQSFRKGYSNRGPTTQNRISLCLRHNISEQILVKSERLDFISLCRLMTDKPSPDLRIFQTGYVSSNWSKQVLNLSVENKPIQGCILFHTFKKYNNRINAQVGILGTQTNLIF